MGSKDISMYGSKDIPGSSSSYGTSVKVIKYYLDLANGTT